MKLTLSPNDTIYKIFKIIKKIAPWKQVDIFLDDHAMLQQQWWLDAFIAQIHEQSLTITLTTKNKYIAEYMIQQWFQVNYIEHHWRSYHWKKILKKIGIEYWKTSSKEFISSKLSLITEILVLWGIIYMFRWTISPKATINITPSIQIQPISYSYLFYPQGTTPETVLDTLQIPWYTGQIHYRVSKTIDLSSFSTTIIAAKWVITLYNTSTWSVSLVQGTHLITDNGILFTTDKDVSIPAWTTKEPWIAMINVTARDSFSSWEPIGEQGNIDAETIVWIEKLTLSIDEKKIWWVAKKKFSGGEILYSWTVVSTDIQHLERILLNEIQQELESIIRYKIAKEPLINIPLHEETKIVIDRFITNAQPGQTASFLQWTIETTIIYPYIKKEDLLKQIQQFLQQRPSPTRQLEHISLESIEFYDSRSIGTGIYSIPTTIQTLRSHNFTTDNDFATKIASKISGMTKEDAIQMILRYDSVQKVDISFSPPRYTTIPNTSDKIIISINKPEQTSEK